MLLNCEMAHLDVRNHISKCFRFKSLVCMHMLYRQPILHITLPADLPVCNHSGCPLLLLLAVQILKLAKTIYFLFYQLISYLKRYYSVCKPPKIKSFALFMSVEYAIECFLLYLFVKCKKYLLILSKIL